MNIIPFRKVTKMDGDERACMFSYDGNNQAKSLAEYALAGEALFLRFQLYIVVIILTAFVIFTSYTFYFSAVLSSGTTPQLILSAFISASFILLVTFLERILKALKVREWALKRALPETLRNAPRSIDALLKLFLVGLNADRRVFQMRELSLTELKADIQFRSFFDQVKNHVIMDKEDCECTSFIYDYETHQSVLSVDEMLEDHFYIQVNWDPSLSLPCSMRFSYVEYEESGRTYHTLEVEENGEMYRGLSTDTISLGRFNDDLDFPDNNPMSKH